MDRVRPKVRRPARRLVDTQRDTEDLAGPHTRLERKGGPKGDTVAMSTGQRHVFRRDGLGSHPNLTTNHMTWASDPALCASFPSVSGDS